MNRNHDDTSRALLAAAHRLLAEDGPEALTVRRIATEAGMSTMNVYSRFGGKDGVIDELYADGYQRLLETLRAIPHTDDVAADMIQLARAYRDFARANPTYYRIMFLATIPGFEPTQESVDLAMTSLHYFVERVERGQQNGGIVSSDGFDAIAIAAGLWATCHGLVSLEIDRVADKYVSWASIFDISVSTAVAGLHPEVATTR
jgi:AcrR family transcriptional regulator